jgi:tetratricopeptide (TPR) repeat protein
MDATLSATANAGASPTSATNSTQNKSGQYEAYVSFLAAQLDYQVTQDLVKMLTDIRFKLLGFLTSLSGGAAAVVSTQTGSLSASTMFLIGLLGFFLTLGVILYDIRNSDLYNACIHRAKILEGVMRFVRSGKEGIKPTSPPEEPALLRTAVALGRTLHRQGVVVPLADGLPLPSVVWPGGAHTQRARRHLSLLGIAVSHGSALTLVYGTLLGAWIFPIAKGFLVLAGNTALWFGVVGRISQGYGIATSLPAFLLAVAGAYVFRRSLAATDVGSAVTGLYNDAWKGKEGRQREQAWETAADEHASDRAQDRVIKSWISAVTVSTVSGVRLRRRLRLWATEPKRKRVVGQMADWMAIYLAQRRRRKAEKAAWWARRLAQRRTRKADKPSWWARRREDKAEWRRECLAQRRRGKGDKAEWWAAIGDAHVAQQNLPGALKRYRASLAITDALAQKDPGDAARQRDLWISHNKVGDVLMAQGDLPEALGTYREGLAVPEKLAKSDSTNIQWPRDLWSSHNKVGDVLMAQGDLPEALDTSNKGLEIAEALAARDPGNIALQRDLSMSLGRKADTLLRMRKRDEARPLAERALKLLREAVPHFPNDPSLSRDLPYYENLFRQTGGTP